MGAYELSWSGNSAKFHWQSNTQARVFIKVGVPPVLAVWLTGGPLRCTP